MSVSVEEITARCVHCAWRTDVARGPELQEVRDIHELIHPGGTALVSEAATPLERIQAIPARPVERDGGPAPIAARNGRTRWTRERAIAAIQGYAREHGYPPSSKVCGSPQSSLPSVGYLKNQFGSFAEAIVAAGFERPTRGGAGRKRTIAPPAQPLSAPGFKATPTLSGASPEGNEGETGAETSLVGLAEQVELARERRREAAAALRAAGEEFHRAIGALSVALEAAETEATDG